MKKFCRSQYVVDRSLRNPRQVGFSVVEIMVALLLGLLVALAASSIYLTSKRSYVLNEAQSRLQEEARIVIAYLQRSLRFVGYRASPDANIIEVFPSYSGSTPNEPSMMAGQVITADQVNSGDGTYLYSKNLAFRFQGHVDPLNQPDVVDCAGRAVSSSDLALNIFHVDVANQELECISKIFGLTSTASSHTEPLTTQFGNLRIFFGINTVDDFSSSGAAMNSVDQYVKPSGLGTWSAKVVSVRIEFSLRSTTDGVIEQAREYDFNGIHYNDRRLVEEFTTSVALRNLLP